MHTQAVESRHWSREPWPWLLMAGPAAVILAGAITSYLAVISNDGLVADDYYKRGLAINQTLARDTVAQQFNYRAHVEFGGDFGQVRVRFGDSVPPAENMVLRLAHPGRPALDRLLPLTGDRDQVYTAAFPVLTHGRWQVTLEDAGRTWRLVGDVMVPGRGVVELAPR